MSSDNQNIHIQAPQDGINFQVYLLFIPAIIFIVVFSLLSKSLSNNQAAYDQNTSVLGEEVYSTPSR